LQTDCKFSGVSCPRDLLSLRYDAVKLILSHVSGNGTASVQKGIGYPSTRIAFLQIDRKDSLSADDQFSCALGLDSRTVLALAFTVGPPSGCMSHSAANRPGAFSIGK
jgi:hypothetical protein